MAETSNQVTRYRFGPFELDPHEGSLARNGIRVRLQDLPYRLLLMLVERRGDVVTREEVRQHLWPENTFVEFDNSLGVAVRKVREALSDSADSPQYVVTIPRRGYRFVAPVSVDWAPETAIVAPPAAMVTPQVVMEAAKGSAASAMPRRLTPRTIYWTGVGLVLLLLIAGAFLRFHSEPALKSGSSVAAEVRLRRSVAVLGFRNLPGRQEDDWLSPVFSEMLDTELGTRGDLRMVSAEDVARVKHEMPAVNGDTLAKATLEQLSKNPGADVVVLGSYTPMPGKEEKRIRLDLRVQNTADGETIAEEAITGDQNNLFDLAARAGSLLRQSLGLSPNSSREAIAARVSLPTDQRSARLYVEGRARLWAFDFLGARELLLKAETLDPGFPLTHSALSEAWWHMGYHLKARAEIERARELSTGLTQEDRLLIEGQYWRSLDLWPKAVDAYRELFRLFPDSLDYGLLLAAAQIDVHPSAALQTLAALRRLPAPLGDDARIDMTEASAWISLDLLKARAAALAAIAKGRAQGHPELVARTYGFLCQQSTGIGGSMQQALSDCESARQSAVSAGDKNGEALMSTDLAALHFKQGDMARGEAMFLVAIDLFRKVGNADGLATAMADLGSVHLAQGNLVEARRLIEGAIVNYQAVEDKEGVALSLDDLGELLRQRGELDAAEANLRLGKTSAEEIENKSAVAYLLFNLGDVFVDRGDLEQARKCYDESLGLRKQVGEQQTVGESEIALARLSTEGGRPGDGAPTLQRWKEQFHLEQQADDEIEASAWLAEAWLAQGKQVAAEKELEESQTLAAKSQNPFARLEYELACARVLTGSAAFDTVHPRVEKLLREARAHGFAGIELEGMLAAAVLEKHAGHSEQARGQLASVEREAREKGFGLVARKAAAARG